MSDLISRQAAMEALQEKVFHDLSDEFYGAMQVLDELPSAVVPVIHAHWIEGEDINCKPIVECSHCGDVWHLDGDSDPFHDHFYHCPNCGAKMDEEVETDE